MIKNIFIGKQKQHRLITYYSLMLALALSFFLPINIVYAKLQPVENYLQRLPKGSDLSLLVQTVDKSPKTLINYQADHFKLPASTQKVITALAAQLSLGSDYTFVTRILTDGKISKQTLNGNLIIQMSGDPSFTRKNLSDMLAVLKLKGVQKISGNIIIDTSVFDSHDKAPGWSWNNISACYNAPPAPAIIDGNCFYAGITPSIKVGEKATTSVANIYPVTISSDIKTIEKKSESIADKYCELDVITSTNNHYHLQGCIEQNSTTVKNNKKLYLRFAIQNSTDYFAAILKSQLQDKKIKFTGKVTETKKQTNKQLTPLAINQSKPLSELLTMMLKNSNNLIADTLFRTLGAHYFSTKELPVAGTWRNSSDAVKAILLEKAGINLENTVIADGSGLSRLNLIDANKMMQVLQYIAEHNDQLHLIEKLPIAGLDGTLKFRKSVSRNQLKNNLYAKTGYLEGNYNLAGFIKLSDKQYLAFVQFISGYHYLTDDKQKPKNTPISQFEESLYLDLLNTK